MQFEPVPDDEAQNPSHHEHDAAFKQLSTLIIAPQEEGDSATLGPTVMKKRQHETSQELIMVWDNLEHTQQ